jgi:hypothetical protein
VLNHLPIDSRVRVTLDFLTWRLVGVIYLALLILYAVVLHPWLMSWGTTTAEQSLTLPGDELPASPSTYFTRAITINAPAEQIWPWLRQIGQDRGGFYSNDWLENIIAADIHNASTIHPEWQTRQLGDVVPLVPPGYLGGLAGSAIAGQPGAAFGPRIRVLQPNRAIADSPAQFVLIPLNDTTTRLLLRESVAANTPGGGVLGTVVGRLVWDPLHFVMEQRMMRGIKERAEGQALVPASIHLIAQVGWALAGLALVAWFLARRRGFWWILLPLAAVVPALAFARDLSAALAVFLATGITIAGELYFGRRWWPTYASIGATVLLILVLAPDAYTAFGLLFVALGVTAAVAGVASSGRAPPARP